MSKAPATKNRRTFELRGLFVVVAIIGGYFLLIRLGGLCLSVTVLLFALYGALFHSRIQKNR